MCHKLNTKSKKLFTHQFDVCLYICPTLWHCPVFVAPANAEPLQWVSGLSIQIQKAGKKCQNFIQKQNFFIFGLLNIALQFAIEV